MRVVRFLQLDAIGLVLRYKGLERGGKEEVGYLLYVVASHLIHFCLMIG